MHIVGSTCPFSQMGVVESGCSYIHKRFFIIPKAYSFPFLFFLLAPSKQNDYPFYIIMYSWSPRDGPKLGVSE